MSSISRVPGGAPDLDPTVATPGAAEPAPAAPARVSRTPSSGGVPAIPLTPATPRPPVAATPTTATALEGVAVGTLAGSGKQVSFDPVRGSFKAQIPGKRADDASRALYSAAELVASGDKAFLTDPKLGATGRMKLASTLETSLAKGNGSTGTPRAADLKARSGAATLSLEMAKTLPDGDPVKARLVTAFVGQLGVESQRGLKASMVLNLEDAVKKGTVKLDSAQAAELAKAKEATFPSKPPYDSWFKNGETLNMRHYVHHEFFEGDCRSYEQMGFKKTVLGPGHYLYEKTVDGENGKKMPVRVETFKVNDEPEAPGELPMDKIFRDMSDPNVQIEFYGGHSNLGGNVLGGVAAGPNIQKGDKWVVNWMCRGQQVLADVYNKYPDAHYMTTNHSVYAHGPKLLNDMLSGIAKRQTYAQMEKAYASDYQSEHLMFPNNPQVLAVRDLDRDGQVDVGSKGVDPLWNTGLLKSREEKRDLKPVASDKTPQDLQGDKVMRGVNFANTFITYHQEHDNDGRLPAGLGDHVTAGGFYVDKNSNDICKITERKVGAETFYDVQVNTKYADQETNTLGAAILYELNRHITKKAHNGQYTEADKLRGAVFAGEFCAYMGETYEAIDDTMGAVRERYGFPAKLTWDAVQEAIDTDDHGYGTKAQYDALKKKIGTVDPRVG